MPLVREHEEITETAPGRRPRAKLWYYTPVPVRLTICGLPPPSSLTEIAAVRIPVWVGVKVALMVQFAPAATLEPQVLVSAKSPGSAPVMLMLVMFKVVLPTLVRVTVWGALVCPTLTPLKFR
jgi:hypothetical protein